MRLCVGIDPGLANTAIVALAKNGDIPIYFKHIKTTVKSDLVSRWNTIAIELKDFLEPKRKEIDTILIYQPLVFPGQSAVQNIMAGSVAVGLIYGICHVLGYVTMRTDKDVRNVLRQAGMGVPSGADRSGKGKVSMRPFVRDYWPDCRNEHLSDAWIGAKYLQITNR